MALALGVRLDEIAERIRGLMNLKAPEGFLDKLKMLPQLGALTSAFPKTVAAKDAPCKEVIRRENLDLNWFPIRKCWPHDGGRFITLPCVVTRDPGRGGGTGKRNVDEVQDGQVYDGQTTAHALATAKGRRRGTPRSTACGSRAFRARTRLIL